MQVLCLYNIPLNIGHLQLSVTKLIALRLLKPSLIDEMFGSVDTSMTFDNFVILHVQSTGLNLIVKCPHIREKNIQY